MERADDPYAPTAPGTKLPGGPSAGDPGLVGRRIGVYEILEEVGRGGMGVVYRARDKSLDRDIALKVLQPSLSKDAEFERRFIREARTAAKLDHPNIVQVHTAGRFEDVLYIAMQLVRGRTLQELMHERGRVLPAEALAIIRQAAEALAAAHAADLVHRDIKPNNIMLDESGRVKLMDFGLMRSSLSGEKITQQGEFFGTPEYASPEQCETSVLDGRSDIYSLGAVLYEMLSGKMPHVAETPLALFNKILREEPLPLRSLNPKVPAEVDALVRRMMAKKREERFASAAELAEEVRKIELGITGATARAFPPPRPGRAALVAATLALVACAGIAWVFLRPAPATPPTPIVTPKPARIKLVVFDLKQGIPGPETAWYEIALSDMLIASLSQQPFLEVSTRDQLLWKVQEMRLEGAVTDDRRAVLTQELGANAYLAGSYYVQGGKIRLTLKAFRLPDNAPAFPVKTFDRGEKDLFGLVDEAARAVAHDLENLASGSAGVVAMATPEAGADRELKLAAAPAQDEKRALSEPQAPAPAAPPAAGAARGDKARTEGVAPSRPGELLRDTEHGAQQRERRKADGASLNDQERVQAWYQNRQALEQCKLGKADFEPALEWLRVHIQEEELDSPARRITLKDALAKAQAWKGNSAMEFVCGGCQAVSPEFGRCEKCRKPMVLRIKIAPAAEKKE